MYKTAHADQLGRAGIAAQSGIAAGCAGVPLPLIALWRLGIDKSRDKKRWLGRGLNEMQRLVSGSYDSLGSVSFGMQRLSGGLAGAGFV